MYCILGKLVKLTLSTHTVSANIGDLKTEELRDLLLSNIKLGRLDFIVTKPVRSVLCNVPKNRVAPDTDFAGYPALSLITLYNFICLNCF